MRAAIDEFQEISEDEFAGFLDRLIISHELPPGMMIVFSPPPAEITIEGATMVARVRQSDLDKMVENTVVIKGLR